MEYSEDPRNERTKLERERKEVLVTFIRGIAEMRGISELTRKTLLPNGEFLSDSVSDVLSALEGNPDPLARVLALQGLFLMAIGLLRIGIESGGGKIKAQERDQLLQRLKQARDAKLPSSRAIDDVIARLAGPILERHPNYSSNRIADLILDSVNKELAPLKISRDAIRKRVQKYRTVH